MSKWQLIIFTGICAAIAKATLAPKKKGQKEGRFEDMKI